MKNILIVFLGGGVGSVCRYLISVLMLRHNFLVNLYFATFLANILGCLLIGLFVGWANKVTDIPQGWILLLTSGFCGGFTTFSTFSLENSALLKEGNFTLLFTYIFLSIVLGLLAVFLGFAIAKNLF